MNDIKLIIRDKYRCISKLLGSDISVEFDLIKFDIDIYHFKGTIIVTIGDVCSINGLLVDYERFFDIFFEVTTFNYSDIVNNSSISENHIMIDISNVLDFIKDINVKNKLIQK